MSATTRTASTSQRAHAAAPNRSAYGHVARELSQRRWHERVLQEGGHLGRQRIGRCELVDGRDADRFCSVSAVLRATAGAGQHAVHSKMRLLRAGRWVSSQHSAAGLSVTSAAPSALAPARARARRRPIRRTRHRHSETWRAHHRPLGGILRARGKVGTTGHARASATNVPDRQLGTNALVQPAPTAHAGSLRTRQRAVHAQAVHGTAGAALAELHRAPTDAKMRAWTAGAARGARQRTSAKPRTHLVRLGSEAAAARPARHTARRTELYGTKRRGPPADKWRRSPRAVWRA